MQAILGSGGSIGIELAKILPAYTDNVRLVSRNPKRVNESDELFPADLSDPDETMKAVEGAEVVYLTVGLKYRVKVWSFLWPKIMSNVIAACKAHHTRLVFFDNIYMYDPKYLGHLDENVPVNPSSKKGKIRAKTAQLLLDEADRGSIKALIARAADFYGPGVSENGMLYNLVLEKFTRGAKANWLCSLNCKHSFTFVRDAAAGTALLGNSEDVYSQVWHLPTAHDPPTGKEWVELIAREMGVKPRVQVAPAFVIRIMGLFSPLMKELVEMLYQYDRDYIFDSTKFEKRFEFKPTAYSEGVRQSLPKILNNDPS